MQSEIDLDNITFVTNDRLAAIMQGTSATSAQVREAVRINVEARLQALKIVLLLVAAVALLFILPARRLPSYTPGTIPDNPPPPDADTLKRAAREMEA